jgi:transcriptional regulator with XRE-family HTH domain
MIPLTTEREIGPLLRRLRLDAGLTMRQLAARTHVSRSGISKREQRHAGYLGIIVGTVNALDYDVVLQKRRHPNARPTGTGWPE